MIAYSPTRQEWTFTSSCPSALKTFLQVLGASFLLALCSQIKIPLPFSPISITLQTLSVMLIGATLGSRKGAMAILLYFAEILIGLPVLAGGIADPLVFLGPKGGYYLGFCIQAYSIGWFVEKEFWSRSLSLLIGGLVGCTLEMALGASVLASFIGWNHVWMMGVAPFIPGEIVKIVLVCFCMKSLNTKSNLALNFKM